MIINHWRHEKNQRELKCLLYYRNYSIYQIILFSLWFLKKSVALILITCKVSFKWDLNHFIFPNSTYFNPWLKQTPGEIPSLGCRILVVKYGIKCWFSCQFNNLNTPSSNCKLWQPWRCAAHIFFQERTCC